MLRSFQIISLSYLNMQLKSLIFFVSGIAISWGATVTDVKTDLINVSDQVTTLNNTIQSFPDSGGTLTSALVNNFCF